MAEPLLTQAAELAGDNVDYWLECGHLRVRVGSLERALQAYETALALGRAGD